MRVVHPTRPARRLVKLLLATLAVCALGGAPRVAGAAPPPSDLDAARLLFKQAQEDEKAERWADALDKLRRATMVKVTPGLLFHVAFCEEKLGKLVDALHDYTAAQDKARKDDNREVLGLVGQPILDLKTRMPTVTINVPSIAGAEVRMDGATIPPPSLGLPIPVDLGSHTIQASAPGQTPYAATVTVAERQALAVTVAFIPLAPVVATEGLPPAPAPAADTSRHHSRLPVILTAAGAAVLLGAGIGGYVASGSDQSYWESHCATSATAASPCGNPTSVRAWDWFALTSWVGSGALLATSIVLWVRDGKPSDAKAAVELRGGPGWAGVAGAF